MRITCAISPQQINNLYKHAYAKMYKAVQQNEEFNVDAYMRDLFEKISKSKDDATAAKFMQQVPSILGTLAFNSKLINLKIKVDPLRELIIKFKNNETGIIDTVKYFKSEVPQETIDFLIKEKQNEAFLLQLTETDPEVPKRPRLKPYSSYTTTFQELLSLNPELIDEFTVEVIDESKKRIYNTLKAIREANGDSNTIVDDVTYQGEKIKLKAVPLLKLENSKLDDYTRALIAKSNTLVSKNIAPKNVTQAKDTVALVVSDEEGKLLYFDEEGNITTKDKGNLVYQFLRDVRLEGDTYVMTNMYGYKDNVLNPEAIAKAEGITVEEAKEIQQKSFEKIFNFKKHILSGNQEVIPLIGVSEGISETISSTDISFNRLSKLPNIKKEDFQTIDVAKVGTPGIPVGRAYMTIDGQNYEVDRAYLSPELINKIASVLTNPNISASRRYKFAAQFLYNNLPASTQRHKLYYNPNNGDITFQYNILTPQQRLKETDIQTKEIQLFLKDTDLKDKTIDEIAEMKKIISDILSVGSHNKNLTKEYSARLNFNSKLLNTGLYSDYDLETGEIINNLDYIDFLTNTNAKVTITTGLESGFYNSYMYFKLPNSFTKSIDQSKKEVEEADQRSFIRRMKDATVSYLQNTSNEAVEVQVTFADRGITPDGKPYAYFTFKSFVPGFEGTSARIYLDPKFKKDITKLPMAGDSVTLQAEDVGIALPVVAAYNNNGEKIGNMQETDFDSGEAPRDYSKLSKEIKEQANEVDVNEGINPTDTPNPSSGGLSDLFDLGLELERSNKLPNGVTQEQINTAKEWWESSPLAKIIPVEHITNIVNSNAYARFIASAKTLDSVKIQINAGKGGNYVDVYHEAWHAFSQLFLTPKEKTKLYNEVRNSNQKYKNYTFLQLEEVIAEDFRTYALKEKTKKDQPVRNSLFRKILNFIKKLLGMISTKDILFQNLYFAGKNPSLINNYTPLIDNVMFDLLNRGPEVIGNKEKQALSEQDGLTVVTSIDSVISEMVDNVYDDTKRKAKDFGDNRLQSKSGTLKLVTDEKNKKVLYNEIKKIFISKRDLYKNDLAKKKEERNIKTTEFNNLQTVEALSKEALATIKTVDGKTIYAFLSSQIDSFENLTPDSSKQKGQLVDNIFISSDFYEHNTIIDDLGQPIEILVAPKASDIITQFQDYEVAGATTEPLNLKEVPELKPLTASAQALLDKIRILEHTILNWGDENTGIVKYHMANSRYDIIRAEEYEADNSNDAINENLQESAKLANKQFGTETVEEMAGKETRYILSSLHLINRKTKKEELDSLGFKKLADFKTVWSKTISAIAGVKNVDKQIEILQKESEVYPEFKQLLEYKLPDPNNPKNAYENSLSTGFYQDFGRLTKYPVIQLTYFQENEKDGTPAKMEVITASINTAGVLSNWAAKFESEESDYTIKNNDNRLILKLNSIIDAFKDDVAAKKGVIQLDTKKSFDFARAIGIFFDESSKDIINNELNKNQKNIEFYGLPFIYTMLSKMSKIELSKIEPNIKNYISEFKLNPLKYLYTSIPKEIPEIGGESQKTQIDRLVNLQLKYGNQDASNQVYNAEGNLINQHSKDNSISMKVYALNNATKLSDLWTSDEFEYMSAFNPAINPFTNRLSIFKNLFAPGAERLRRQSRSLELFLNSGFQINNTKGTSLTGLDAYSKFLHEFHTFTKAGVKEFIRAASKSSSFGVRIKGGIIDPTLGGEKSDPHLWIDIDRFGNNTGEKYAFDNHILEYIAGEYDRIKKFKANKEVFKNYKGYNRIVKGTKENPTYAGESFIAFNDVLKNTTKRDIIKKVGDQDLIQYLKTDQDLYDTIYKDVQNYFNVQTEDNLDILANAEYIEPALLNQVKVFTEDPFEQKNILMKAYTYNSWIQNFETVIIFLGDPAEINHKKEEEHKRNTGAQSNGPGFRNDVGIRQYINDKVRKSSYAASLGEGYNNFVFSNKFNTAIIKDVERDSVYYKEIFEGLKEDYAKRLEGINIPNKEKVINDKAKKEADKYLKMEEGDGQGWITFDAYRALKIAENDWDWVDQERLFQKVIKGEKLEEKDIKKFFPPYKVQYHGSLANSQENMNSGETGSVQLPVTAMHKFELGILIPSMIKDMELDKLHKQMLKKNIQYVTFGTGSKVGAITSDGQYDDIFEEGSNQKKIKSDINFTNNIIYLDFLKKVTNMPSKFKNRNIFPTQQRVLAFDGLFNQGDIINPTEERIKAVNEYKDTVDGFSEILQEKLLDELGAERLEDGSYKINNMLKLMKVVDKELKRRDLPKHLRKYIGVNPDKTAKIDLSFHPSADEIETIITNLIEKRLVKQKVKGEAYIQIASPMTNGAWNAELEAEADTPEKVRKIVGSNDFPFYRRGEDGNTMAMKVGIALQGDFFNLLNGTYKGEVIGTIERLNQAIKDDEWLDENEGRNRQAITLTGVRIPTDSKSQMDFMEVYQFLDPASSNIIILPSEMVAKSGTDYDGDKLTTSTPHISKKGNFIRRKWTTKEVMQKVAELKKKGKTNEAKLIIELHQKVLENELIQATKNILTLKDNYANLVRPNMVDTLEDFADSIQEYTSEYDRFKRVHGEKSDEITPTKIFEEGYNLHKFQVNLDSARPLGITAVDNKLGPLMNSIGAKLPTDYKASNWDDNKKKYVDNDEIDYRFRVFLPTNKLKIGEKSNISLSNETTSDGLNSISILKSMLLNGFLDVEKKPWAFYIGGNETTTPLLLDLMSMGVPYDSAILFVVNPMVREYVKQLNLIKSNFAPLIGTAVDSPSFNYYQAALRAMEKFGFVGNQYAKLIQNRNYYNAVTQIVEGTNLLNEDKVFDKNKMLDVLKYPDKPDNKKTMFGMFLHYLELEKQLKGYRAFKFQLNPDTRVSKTLQEIIRRELAYLDLSDMSKLDQETAIKAREESLLSSFFIGKLIIDIVKPLFPFRNDDRVTDYISYVLTEQREVVTKKYGGRREDIAKFITNYKNAIATSLFQNSFGDQYYDFINFKQKNIEPQIKSISFQDMIGNDPNSFNYQVMNTIKSFITPDIKAKYPIIEKIQIREVKKGSGTYTLTLSNAKAVRKNESGLADIYYQNLLELSNPLISKSEDTEINMHISNMFYLMSLTNTFVNGLGYSAFGIIKTVPYDTMLNMLQEMSPDFIDNKFNDLKFFDNILNVLLNDDPVKNYIEQEYTGPELSVTVSIPGEIKDIVGPTYDAPNITDEDTETGVVLGSLTFGAQPKPTTRPFVQVNERIRKEYPNEITEGNKRLSSKLLIDLANLKLGNNVFVQPEESTKEYWEDVEKVFGEPAGDYVDFSSIEITYEEGNFLKNNPIFAKALVDAYKKDWETRDDYQSYDLQQFAQMLLDKNEIIVDTYQLSLFDTEPTVEREYTPDNITKENMPANGIFVFGSNDRGVHGLGAAKTAVTEFGAIKGQAIGQQGQSFAVRTKMHQNDKLTKYNELTPENKEAMDKMTIQDMNALRLAAIENPNSKYYVTEIGTRLAGRSVEQMKDFFKRMNDKFGIPDNIILPKVFEVRNAQPSAPVTEPTVTTPVANVPQNKVSGIESFGSLVTANAEAIKALGPNPHSIDMIEAGFRTRTTRSESEMAKYAIKVGDVIKHFGKSADGSTKNILARVTAIHPKGSPGWKGTWNKEGWRAKDVDVIDRFKDGAAAIEFEVIQATQPSVQPIKQFKNSLFRGQENEPVVDSNGNLVLVSTYDSLFKSEGISFAEDEDMARGYGLRYSKNPYIIEIDADYADTIFPLDKSGGTKSYGKRVIGDQGEQRFVSKEDVIIPKGKFKITRRERTFNFETFTPEQLIQAYNKQFTETDIAEYNRYGEVSAGYATEGSDYYDAIEKELLRRGISKNDFLFLRTANAIFSIEEIVADAYNIKIEPGELTPDVSKEQIQEFLNKQSSLKNILKANTQPTVQPVGEIKEGVSELFESNPELANDVYETLGFKEYSKETKNKLALTESLKDIFKDKSTVLFRAGEDADEFYVDLVKTSDNRYFMFLENQSPTEISEKQFAEEIKFIDGQIATTEEKNKFINSYLEIADLDQISENPLLTKEEKLAAQKDILKKVTPQQKQQAQQIYSQYLDTIFPDSKVKDIVYRGAEKGIENHRAYSHWTLRKTLAENFVKQGVNLNKKDESQNTLYFALLNIKNLVRSIEITDKSLKEQGFDSAASFPNQQKPDGTYYDNEEANEAIQLIDKNLNNEITVFEPEQIHILGSKQDIEGFKNFVSKVSTTGIEATKRLFQEAVTEPILINQDDINRFNSVVERNNGLKPNEFYTSDKDFDLFSNTEELKTSEDKTASKWLLNPDGTYNLVDQFTDEIYLRNINLSTGQQVKTDTELAPVNEKQKSKLIKSLRDGVADYKLDEILAERGYDINEIINNLEAVSTQDAFVKMVAKILKNIC